MGKRSSQHISCAAHLLQHISCVLWNVHGGLNRAYNKADALNDLHTLDCTFICLTETWTAPGDAVFDLPGYVCHEVHRPQHLQGRNGSRGGIAVYMKQCMADHVSFWKSADDGTYIWLHIEPHGGCTEHIAFATCYIPPYCTDRTLDTFEKLTIDMDNFASRVPAGKQPHYWVCGDTNAHTGIAPDFIRLDGHGISSDVQALDLLPADLKARANLCTHKVDVRGKQQLDFCKDNELLILNGRAPGDTSGKVTFVGRGAGTLIDYHMVQQGSPLSPLLFGLLIDCLHKVLKAVPGNYAPSLAAYWFTAAGRKWKMQKPVPLLLYADDLAILSTRSEGLQRMLDALQDFSKKRRLIVQCIGAAHPQLWL